MAGLNIKKYSEALKQELPKLREFLVKINESENPYQFTKFPILLPVREVYKPDPETGKIYVDLSAVESNFARIRRSGNWPKLFRCRKDMHLCIAATLLAQLHSDEFVWAYRDTFLYINLPEDSEIIKVINEFSEEMDGGDKFWDLLSIDINNQNGIIGAPITF